VRVGPWELLAVEKSPLPIGIVGRAFPLEVETEALIEGDGAVVVPSDLEVTEARSGGLEDLETSGEKPPSQALAPHLGKDREAEKLTLSHGQAKGGVAHCRPLRSRVGRGHESQELEGPGGAKLVFEEARGPGVVKGCRLDRDEERQVSRGGPTDGDRGRAVRGGSPGHSLRGRVTAGGRK
jgi:hypothetical protein